MLRVRLKTKKENDSDVLEHIYRSVHRTKPVVPCQIPVDDRILFMLNICSAYSPSVTYHISGFFPLDDL